MNPKEMAETLKSNWVGHLHHWVDSVQFAIEEAIQQERESCGAEAKHYEALAQKYLNDNALLKGVIRKLRDCSANTCDQCHEMMALALDENE